MFCGCFFKTILPKFKISYEQKKKSALRMQLCIVFSLTEVIRSNNKYNALLRQFSNYGLINSRYFAAGLYKFIIHMCEMTKTYISF